jgi:hypothetical protein
MGGQKLKKKTTLKHDAKGCRENKTKEAVLKISEINGQTGQRCIPIRHSFVTHSSPKLQHGNRYGTPVGNCATVIADGARFGVPASFVLHARHVSCSLRCYITLNVFKARF